MAREAPDEDQIREWMQTLSNWGRWGTDDERGTLNFITREKRREAAALVREGTAVSCARQIRYDLDRDILRPSYHFMQLSGDRANPEGQSSAGDAFLIAPHGGGMTHLDAICHFFWKGQMYNGRPAGLVSTEQGATVASIEAAAEGVFTCGVLLDMTRVFGDDWLEPGEAIFPEDLEAAEEAQGVRVGPGDALLVRTGFPKRRAALGPPPPLNFPGLQAACLPWLHARQIAVLACDTSQEPSPSGYPTFFMPVHVVGIVAMGLWLIDNCDHEALAAACEGRSRWEFLFTLAPLRFKNGTGSPVNPTAIL
jgi:kynurenine formamidase